MTDYLLLLGHRTEPQTVVCPQCGNRFILLAGARSGKCCQCRRKQRQAEATIPHPRELAPGAFATQAQLNRWYNRDQLKCHICGQAVSGLQYHIRFVHKVSPKEYRRLYNIPATYGLLGRSRREAQKVYAARTVAKMAEQGYPNLTNARARKTGKRQRATSFQERASVQAMVDSPNHPSKREGEALLYCTKCGEPVEIPASVAPLHQCRVRCERCSPRKARRRQHK